jgi:threonine dehydrogenase-like Zn-dependent dehydrogenase
MQAAVLVNEGVIEIREILRPELQSDDDVLICVRSVGICGSEVHVFRGTHPYRKAPAILGHELAGEAVSAGSAAIARGLQPGRRVTVDPVWACGACEHCRSGDYNLCADRKYWVQLPGPVVSAHTQLRRPGRWCRCLRLSPLFREL